MPKICKLCGKEFNSRKTSQKYCSPECYQKSRKKYIIGKKFGKLTVIKEIEENKYLCKCDCGKETITYSSHLITGHTKSCGCNKKQVGDNLRTHGLSTTRLYIIWKHMVERCCNKNNKSYCNYGNRGIKVCYNWRTDFTNFYNWAIDNGYVNGLTIERIDNNGNYEPNNCRWATNKEQQRNKRNNNLVTFNGETLCISEWAERFNIKYHTLWARINIYGWSTERALTTK